MLLFPILTQFLITVILLIDMVVVVVSYKIALIHPSKAPLPACSAESSTSNLLFKDKNRFVLKASTTERLQGEKAKELRILKSPSQQRDIVIIGTVHYSTTSFSLVQRVIHTVQPDTVMIELDRKRVNLLMDNGTLEGAVLVDPKNIENTNVTSLSFDYTKSIQSESLLSKIKNFFCGPIQAFRTMLIAARLIQIQQRDEIMMRFLGFRKGAEFITAVQEAKAVGAKVLLGDVDLDMTRNRMLQAWKNLSMKR